MTEIADFLTAVAAKGAEPRAPHIRTAPPQTDDSYDGLEYVYPQAVDDGAVVAFNAGSPNLYEAMNALGLAWYQIVHVDTDTHIQVPDGTLEADVDGAVAAWGYSGVMLQEAKLLRKQDIDDALFDVLPTFDHGGNTFTWDHEIRAKVTGLLAEADDLVPADFPVYWPGHGGHVEVMTVAADVHAFAKSAFDEALATELAANVLKGTDIDPLTTVPAVLAWKDPRL